MNKKQIEFDRTLSKTHKSRYTKITLAKTSGFTLIELLVVISIIALLSTVVLAAINDGRVKARNAAKNESIHQYINAIELYRSNNSDYPIFGNGALTPNTNSYACLGFAETSESCFGSVLNIDGSNTLNTSLSPYFNGNIPKDTKTILAGAWGDMKGVVYACKSNTDCSAYKLLWHIEGIDQKCGSGSFNANISGSTRCQYSN